MTPLSTTQQRHISLYECVCSDVPVIHKTVTHSCGVVHQISCRCGKGVHGRTIEEAKELWDMIQKHLHNKDEPTL